MPRLNRPAQEFLKVYATKIGSTERTAELLGAEVERIVRDTGAFVHVVTARAKTLDSLRGKLRRKPYKHPNQRLTDLIGVRVITYYRDTVDPIVARLRQSFEINERDTIDKRRALGRREFGYRSVHLIARLASGQMLSIVDKAIRKRWFEIQVRSVMEHAWAEIEHEIVYKSGVVLPDAARRRFARLAGTLELLDNEFLALRDTRNPLIGEYCDLYKEGKDQKIAFDVARLWGFLEVAWPEGRSWRQAAAENAPFYPGLEVSCVEALKAVGLGTPISLRTMMKMRQFRRAVNSFAADQGVAPAQLSHVAVVVLAVAIKDLRVVKRHFPEFMNDPALASILNHAEKPQSGQFASAVT
ncbi:MAG: GTP pyrophosphokinase family protein [Candidatus Binataceae bacterium]